MCPQLCCRKRRSQGSNQETPPDPPHPAALEGVCQWRCPSGPYLLWVEEDVSQALQAQHADLGAGVPEASGQYNQGSLPGEHLQQGGTVEELGQPPRAGGSGLAPSCRGLHVRPGAGLQGQVWQGLGGGGQVISTLWVSRLVSI